LIRHARLRLTAAAVLPLTVAMIEPPFRALLVAAVGAPPLLAAGLLAALVAAVAVSAIAVRTDRVGGGSECFIHFFSLDIKVPSP